MTFKGETSQAIKIIYDRTFCLLRLLACAYSGACLVGRKEGNQNCSEDQTQVVTPGNLPFHGSTDIVFEACSFVHLGASAVEFTQGAQQCVVNGCHFHDISGAAVQIGTVNSSQVTDPAAQDRFNVVNNSVISLPAAELHGIPGEITSNLPLRVRCLDLL